LHNWRAPEQGEPDGVEKGPAPARNVAEVFPEEVDGTLGRGAGREQIQSELERARRQGLPLAIVFFDVDASNRVDDADGHGSREELLAAAGTALHRSLRRYDLVVRWGAEEFVCAIPGKSSPAAAARIGEIATSLERDFPGAVMSPGHSQLEEGDTLDEVVQRARRDSSRHRAPAQTADTTNPPAASVPSVSCFGCGGRVALDDFVLDVVAMRRYADCAGCGATTVIHLDAGCGG